MVTKTYGIKGLLEKHCVLKAGGMTMKVSFTNGTLTNNGIAPATFTTSDPLTQFVIEHCDKFKRKEIEVVRVVDDGRPIEGIVVEEPRNAAQAAATPTPDATKATTAPAPTHATAPVAAATVASTASAAPAAEPQDNVEIANDGENATEMQENSGDGVGEGDNCKAEKVEAEVTIEDDGTRVVRVATRPDAVAWLKENFPANNYTATALRTKAPFEAACAECKVRFIIANA